MTKLFHGSCVIYVLCDRRKRGAKRIFYIGKSRDPQARLAQHISEAKRKLVKSKKDAKILELCESKVGIHLAILEIVEECKQWQSREQWWVAEYKRRGATLLNVAPAGMGNRPGGRRQYKRKGVSNVSEKQ